jgi:hypothetical protein
VSGNGKRRSRGAKVNLCCDRIDDVTLFKAVCFAITMMRQGTTPNIANARAASYYKVSTTDVAFYAAQHAGRIGASRRGRAKAASAETGGGL